MRVVLNAINIVLLLLLISPHCSAYVVQSPAADKYPPGLTVTRVVAGSDAESAGLKPADVVIALGGKPVRFTSQVTAILEQARWDHLPAVPVEVRRNGAVIGLDLPISQDSGFFVFPPMSQKTAALFTVAEAAPAGLGAAVKFKAAVDSALNEGDERAAASIWDYLATHAPADSNERKAALIASRTLATTTGDAIGAAESTMILSSILWNQGDKEGGRTGMLTAVTALQSAEPNSTDMLMALSFLGLFEAGLDAKNDSARHLEQAQNIVERLYPDSLSVCALLHVRGWLAFADSHYAEVEAFCNRALEIENRIDPNSLDVSQTEELRGALASARLQFEEADRRYSRALEIRDKLAPNTAELASTLCNAAYISMAISDMERARGFGRRALEIRLKLAPKSLDEERCRVILGDIARMSGRLDEAEESYTQAFEICEKSSPNSIDLADCLTRLGDVKASRGKLQEAEQYNRRALAIAMKLAPKSGTAAASLSGMARVATSLGMLDEAKVFQARSLGISADVSPQSVDYAASLNGLALIAIYRGKLDEAEAYCKQAADIEQRIAPKSAYAAQSLSNHGIVALRRSRLTDADQYLAQALDLWQKIAPDSVDEARTLNALGESARQGSRLDMAESHFQRAKAILDKLAPGSLELAGVLNNLGLVELDRHHADRSIQYLRLAWSIVRAQGRNISGDSGRRQFEVSTLNVAGNLLHAELLVKNAPAALVTLEEGRAQALIQSICERDVTERVTPSAIWKAYLDAEHAHDIAQKKLEQAALAEQSAQSAIRDAKEMLADVASLAALQKTAEVTGAARTAAHDAEVASRSKMEGRWRAVLASSKATPINISNAGSAQRLLPSDTLLLEFSVSSTEVTLFAITANLVSAVTLPTKKSEIEALVTFVRKVVAQETDKRGVKNVSSTDRAVAPLRALYQKLFPADVQAAISRAKRIVISPDDLLWDLPFAALIVNSSGAPVYLGLQKPLSYTQSLTLCVTPMSSTGIGVGALIVGNPVYTPDGRKALAVAAHAVSKPSASHKLSAAGPTKKSASPKHSAASGEAALVTRDGNDPGQLIEAQHEAEQVAKLYKTSPHTGIEPTEAWLRQRISTAKIVHLATHGQFNAHMPQSSGVLLAVPEKAPPALQYDNDGVLQAWEVWSLRLHAELVVLSACETARGRRSAGEGLVGLTRAFQYAGAKAIVSSQWSVNDASTSALMTAFHRRLIAGDAKDEALRVAMNLVAHENGEWSDPFHWAAFLIIGDTGKLH